MRNENRREFMYLILLLFSFSKKKLMISIVLIDFLMRQMEIQASTIVRTNLIREQAKQVLRSRERETYHGCERERGEFFRFRSKNPKRAVVLIFGFYSQGWWSIVFSSLPKVPPSIFIMLAASLFILFFAYFFKKNMKGDKRKRI